MCKELNAEEIALLRNSPYVAEVKGRRIRFTSDFKRMAYEQLCLGKDMRTIFEDHGIDPELLGRQRIWNFASRVQSAADREGGFADLRSKNSRKPAMDTKERGLEARIEDLEHKLAYANQQIEFLKKIHVADLEARKQWESRLSQKKNSK